MKKVLKILGIIFLIIAVAVTGLAIWQRDKIKAIYIGYKYTPEEIQEKMDESHEKLQKDIESVTGIPFREITEEEQKKIDSGEITKSEVFEIIVNETIEKFLAENGYAPQGKTGQDETNQDNPTKETSTTAPNTQNSKTKKESLETTAKTDSSETTAKTDSPDKTSSKKEEDKTTPKANGYSEIVASYTARLYSLKGSYLGQLEGLLAQADAEFHALPQSSWTVPNRSAIISKYIGIAASLESACDGEVASLLSSLESELNAIGADTSIVSTMRNAYYEEKSLKISYYMSQMK